MLSITPSFQLCPSPQKMVFSLALCHLIHTALGAFSLTNHFVQEQDYDFQMCHEMRHPPLHGTSSILHTLNTAMSSPYPTLRDRSETYYLDMQIVPDIMSCLIQSLLERDVSGSEALVNVLKYHLNHMKSASGFLDWNTIKTDWLTHFFFAPFKKTVIFGTHLVEWLAHTVQNQSAPFQLPTTPTQWPKFEKLFSQPLSDPGIRHTFMTISNDLANQLHAYSGKPIRQLTIHQNLNITHDSQHPVFYFDIHELDENKGGDHWSMLTIGLLGYFAIILLVMTLSFLSKLDIDAAPHDATSPPGGRRPDSLQTDAGKLGMSPPSGRRPDSLQPDTTPPEPTNTERLEWERNQQPILSMTTAAYAIREQLALKETDLIDWIKRTTSQGRFINPNLKQRKVKAIKECLVELKTRIDQIQSHYKEWEEALPHRHPAFLSLPLTQQAIHKHQTTIHTLTTTVLKSEKDLAMHDDGNS